MGAPRAGPVGPGQVVRRRNHVGQPLRMAALDDVGPARWLESRPVRLVSCPEAMAPRNVRVRSEGRGSAVFGEG